MGRPRRVLVDNGVYHIMNRGHNKYKIFHTSCDYLHYKRILRHYKKRFNFDLFHYCLMPNHIHLLLRIPVGSELPSLMQSLAQAYAKYYKRQYNHIGNLFQGRYKSIYIDNDSYLLECGRYIERNPLRAELVTQVSSYPFSSFNFYANNKIDDILTINPLYAMLSKDACKRMKLYAEYVLQERPYEKMVDNQLKL